MRMELVAGVRGGLGDDLGLCGRPEVPEENRELGKSTESLLVGRMNPPAL